MISDSVKSNGSARPDWVTEPFAILTVLLIIASVARFFAAPPPRRISEVSRRPPPWAYNDLIRVQERFLWGVRKTTRIAERAAHTLENETRVSETLAQDLARSLAPARMRLVNKDAVPSRERDAFKKHIFSAESGFFTVKVPLYTPTMQIKAWLIATQPIEAMVLTKPIDPAHPEFVFEINQKHGIGDGPLIFPAKHLPIHEHWEQLKYDVSHWVFQLEDTAYKISGYIPK